MLFEKSILPLTKILQDELVGYINPTWTREALARYYNGEGKGNKADKIVAKFVCDNLVEAPTTEVARTAIMQYTFGYFCRDIVYKNRFRNSPVDLGVYTAHSKLSFANALIQWKLMCEQLGFDWDEMLALGQEHLNERYKDFIRDGWTSS